MTSVIFSFSKIRSTQADPSASLFSLATFRSISLFPLLDDTNTDYIKLNASSPLQNGELPAIASREIDRTLSSQRHHPEGTRRRVSHHRNHFSDSAHSRLTCPGRLYVRNGGAPSLTKEDVDESHDRQPAYHWVSTTLSSYIRLNQLTLFNSSMAMEC